MLVISIKAGGRGLNLPAANHVFHFDRWWNPAVEQQATDRVHRVGQRKPVFVHSLICIGTLEERIDAAARVEARARGEGDPRRARRTGSADLDIGAIRAAVALSPDWMEAARHERAASVSGAWARPLRDRGRPRRRLGGRGARPRCSCAKAASAQSRSSRERSAAEVDGCSVAITAKPVPPRIWAAMVRAARGNVRLEEAVEGRTQSVHLEHLMIDDWSEPLVPRAFELGRACSCDESSMCEHVAALAYAVALAIDADPSLLLRWRGCVAGRARVAGRSRRRRAASGDGGARRPDGRAPVARRRDARAPPLRPLPVGAVLKRLGPSGLKLRGEDLAAVLQRAYDSFAASADS